MSEKIEVSEPNSAQPTNYEITVKDHRIYQMVYFSLGVLEVLLGFRFFFKLLGANPGNVFAMIVYGITAPFVFPFTGLFKEAVSELPEEEIPNVFEPTILVAMVFYILLAVGVAKLILIIRTKPTK